MSKTINYNFLNPNEWDYNTNEFDLSSGDALLKLQSASVPFTQEFNNDTGFTYNSNFAEFPGTRVQQKDTRPLDATVQATFPANQNSDWGGNITNTLGGGATWDNGTIDLSGLSGKTLTMPGSDGNFNTVGTAGCIRFTYIPNYGALIGIRDIFEYDADTGNNNSIFIYQNGANMIIDLRDSGGVQHLLIAGVGNLTQLQPYVFELNFDFDGISRFFVDGILKGSLDTSAWTRNAVSGNFVFGDAGGNANFWLDNVIAFSSVQHTGDHAGELPYTYYTTIYVENAVILPEMEHTGDGSILSFNSFVTVEGNNPGYTLQIGRSGDYLWYNAGTWQISDGSYSQSNDVITFNTNVGSLPVAGEKYGQFKIIFPNQNLQGYVSTLTANMVVNTGYLITNPLIKTVLTVRSEALINLAATPDDTGNNYKRFIIILDGINKWVDSGTWKTSTGFDESNTLTEINQYAQSLIDQFGYIGIGIYFHSENGTVTPECSTLTMIYDFAGVAPDTIDYCTVWGYLTDPIGDGEGKILIELNKEFTPYKTNRQIYKKIIEVEPDPDKQYYWEVDLIENENMEAGSKYIFKIGNARPQTLEVKNVSDSNFNDLI